MARDGPHRTRSAPLTLRGRPARRVDQRRTPWRLIKTSARARLLTLSRLKIAEACTFTVPSESPSRSAISRLVLPWKQVADPHLVGGQSGNDPPARPPSVGARRRHRAVWRVDPAIENDADRIEQIGTRAGLGNEARRTRLHGAGSKRRRQAPETTTAGTSGKRFAITASSETRSFPQRHQVDHGKIPIVASESNAIASSAFEASAHSITGSRCKVFVPLLHAPAHGLQRLEFCHS